MGNSGERIFYGNEPFQITAFELDMVPTATIWEG
jgi:hypothetical protein